MHAFALPTRLDDAYNKTMWLRRFGRQNIPGAIRVLGRMWSGRLSVR